MRARRPTPEADAQLADINQNQRHMATPNTKELGRETATLAYRGRPFSLDRSI